MYQAARPTAMKARPSRKGGRSIKGRSLVGGDVESGSHSVVGGDSRDEEAQVGTGR
jgi:hypothetical protein